MHARSRVPLGALLLALAAGACSHAPPSIEGTPSAPPSQSQPWRVPANAVPREPVALTPPALPDEIAPRANSLALDDIVDVALRNNPQTRISWSQARAGAASYGAASAAYVPTIDATSNLVRTQTTSQLGASERNAITPTATLSYLLFDFGGRSGTIAAARAAAVALDLTHNATLQNVALQAEAAYFTYQGQRQLVQAARQTLAVADTNLVSARQRNQAGVATITDVLQAQTQRAQSELDLETAEGNLQVARGNLALAMGLKANTRFEVQPAQDSLAVSMVATSVDTLINRALALRPDLAALRSSIAQAQAQVRVARSAELPAITLGANVGKTISNVTNFTGLNYGITLGVQIPIFNLARPYNVTAAEAQVDVASGRADLLRVQVAQQVYAAYYSLQTATQRVRTSDVLLASATQNEVAARARYRAGVGTILDLITGADVTSECSRAASAGAFDLGQALAQLSHDVGVLGPRGQDLPAGADSTGIRR